TRRVKPTVGDWSEERLRRKGSRLRHSRSVAVAQRPPPSLADDARQEPKVCRLVWGFSCQGAVARGWAVDPLAVVCGLFPVLCSERKGRSSSRRLRSDPRSARRGSRDRNASRAWRLAALASLVFRSALTPEHAAGRQTAR